MQAVCTERGVEGADDRLDVWIWEGPWSEET